MPEQAVAAVTLTDLSRPARFPDPWQVQVASLSVQDRLGLLGDTATLAFDRENGESGSWPVGSLADFPRSVRVDVNLGTEGGAPPVEHGPYYARRASGAIMESGAGYTLGLTRASASADMERILRFSMLRQYAWLVGRGFPVLSTFTVQQLSEVQGYDGLVSALVDLGLGVSLAPLGDASFQQLQAIPVGGDADLWDDSLSPEFLAGWRGIPVPFLYRLDDLFNARPPDRARSGYGVDLFDTATVLDLSEYDLVEQAGDLRRRNNLTENRANVRYTLKGDDELQRSELQQAGRTGLDAIGKLPLEPSGSDADLLPPRLLSGEFPDEASANLAVYGRAAQQTLEAISATVEADWNPYLRNGQVASHSSRRYRIIEIAHDLGKLGTTLTLVPLLASNPF